MRRLSRTYITCVGLYTKLKRKTLKKFIFKSCLANLVYKYVTILLPFTAYTWVGLLEGLYLKHLT